MKYWISFTVLVVLVFGSHGIMAQSQSFTLDQVIRIAQKQSPDALVAKYELISNYWAYRNFKRGLMPQINFTGTLPNVNRAFSNYINPDGSQSYIGQSYISYSGLLQVEKRLGFTGGNVFLNTGLQKVDNYYDTITTHDFLSTPINIGISQPLFNYNPYKWNKKIEPLKYKEAKRHYIETIEQVSITAVRYYFELLKAQLKLEINELNVQNYDTLYKIAKGRLRLGKIEENDFLQLELNLLQSQSALELAQLNYENATYKFKSFLRIDPQIQISLSDPKPVSFVVVDKKSALKYATENSSVMINLQRQMLQANALLDKAKKENGLNANLYAVFGLTQSANVLNEAYRDPHDQQNLNVGIKIPLYDWGLRKGEVKMAQSNLEIAKSNVEQARIDFMQNIYLQVAKFNMQQNQLYIAAKSDTVAQRSYEITKHRYFLGKISVTDLNIAQKSNDQARLNYLSSLQAYWESYYQLRKNTLFDFEKKTLIDVDFEDLLK